MPTDLFTQSASTRKASSTREDRVSKRREKWPVVAGFEPRDVPNLPGETAIVQSSSQGGYMVEYLDENGYGHAVPVECLQALGFSEPKSAQAAR